MQRPAETDVEEKKENPSSSSFSFSCGPISCAEREREEEEGERKDGGGGGAVSVVRTPTIMYVKRGGERADGIRRVSLRPRSTNIKHFYMKNISKNP